MKACFYPDGAVVFCGGKRSGITTYLDYPDEQFIFGGNIWDMTTYLDEEVICEGNSRDIPDSIEDTFQAALPEYSSSVSSGEDADEDGVCGKTFQAYLPEYSSSVSSGEYAALPEYSSSVSSGEDADEDGVCAKTSQTDLPEYSSGEDGVCGKTFQAALPEYSSSVGAGEVADEDGVCAKTFQADLPVFISSDDEYASSISYLYSEEEEDEVSDEDENAATIIREENEVRLLDVYCYYREGVNLFKSNKPSKQEWKASWPTEGETTESAWVHVYGFYNAETNEGGYGVIVRNMAAKPIAASTYFSLYGVTYLYQVLKGLDAGLKLALKHGCSSPRVICNSRVVVRLLTEIASGFCHKRNCSGIKVNNVCQSCTMSMVPRMTSASFKPVAPLINSLQGKLHFSNFSRQSRIWNKAAYYLAKQAKKTLLVFGWGYRDYKADIKPEKFSVDLLDILWKDAYDSLYYNMEARTNILQSYPAVIPQSVCMREE